MNSVKAIAAAAAMAAAGCTTCDEPAAPAGRADARKYPVVEDTTGQRQWKMPFRLGLAGYTAHTVRCSFPKVDAVGSMTTWAGNIPPEWNCGFSSALHTQAPIASLFSDSSENRAMLACSEAFRRVKFRLGLVEETAEAVYSAELFSEPEVVGFTVWQFADARSYFRGGSNIRAKPFAMNLAGLFDGYRREKLAAGAVRKLFAEKSSGR